MRKPTLSVIMPNYNHAKYVGEALEAILSQSYRPMEVIVVDDASTDNSVEIIQEFVKQNRNLRLIVNEKNIGVEGSVEKLLNLAGGDYVFAIAADDKILPGFFEKSMEILERFPKAGLCCVDPVFIDNDGNTIGEDEFCLSDKPNYFTPEEMILLLRKKLFSIGGNNVIIKRSALTEAGNFVHELRWYSDLFAVLVVAFRYGMCYIPERMVVKRIDPKQYSSNPMSDRKVHSETLENLLRLLHSPAYSDVRSHFKRSTVLSFFYTPMLWSLLRNPNYWDLITLKLIPRTLWRTFKKKLNPYLPMSIKNIYYNIKNKHSKRLIHLT